MKKIFTMLLILAFHSLFAMEKPLAIRGTLPWHNFLCGPTAWNETDYRQYLDRMQSLGLNFIAFHCYTGGAERYATYVEPLICLSYRNVIPQAFLDHSLSSRWGYRPMALQDFVFDSRSRLHTPAGAAAFGSDAAVLSRDNEEHYQRTRNLMRRVLTMAHERGIQMAMGFEFGIHPPEFASIVPPESIIRGAMTPDPMHPSSCEILYDAIDDILTAYPGIDHIWLWLHEHTMFVGSPQMKGEFAELYRQQAPSFQQFDETCAFTGVWSLAYIQKAYAYIKNRTPQTKIAIAGWGGGNQLMPVLQGLDKLLPQDIIFTCLNPNQGQDAQPAFLAEIAGHRPVFAIPWLEGDKSLWHLQPRVTLLREQVKLAAKQNLHGVVAIHWRTDEVKLNMDAFARFANYPQDTISIATIYRHDIEQQYGAAAVKALLPLLTAMDRGQWYSPVESPEYYPYAPYWGRLSDDLLQKTRAVLQIEINPALLSAQQKKNLQWLRDQMRFALYLDEFGRKIEPLYALRNHRFTGKSDTIGLAKTMKEFRSAPVESLITVYGRCVRSRGQQGVLSSINQRVWLQYRELEKFLQEIEQ